MNDTEKSAQAQSNESAEPSFRYNAKLAQGVEEKWQKIWDDEGTFWAANVNGELKDGKGHNAEGRPSYFAMDMFPYPSGSTLYHGCIYKMFKPRYTIFCTHAVDSIHDFLP